VAQERTLEILEKHIEQLEEQIFQFEKALRELWEFKLPGHLDKNSEYYEEGDDEAPFFSEAYLYNLLEKEDARTVLAYLHAAERPFGYRDGRKIIHREEN
jgi:hypothetical protein